MKVILITALTVAFAVGCGGADRSADVVASVYPLAFAAEQVAAPGTDVVNLTPPGAEPHDLEVTPRDVETLRSARLVLLLGRGFQPQLEDAAGTGAGVLRLLDTPGLRVRADGDPHVWLDPTRFALVVRRIASALGRSEAGAGLAARLETLDRDYRRGLADCARREIVTSHAAFAYLADRYRLEQVAISGLSPEAEPDPRALERVVATVRRTGATTVFFEPLVSPRVAETVAREAGVATAVLDPLEGLTAAEGETPADYFTVMRANLARLQAALGCR